MIREINIKEIEDKIAELFVRANQILPCSTCSVITKAKGIEKNPLAQSILGILEENIEAAKELDVPVIALSQLNRASETGKRRPQLSDLRESGAIEQDADIVMFIHRPDRAPSEDGDVQPQNRTEAEIILAKNRSGACESFKLLFKGEQTKFVNIVYNSPEPPEYIANPKQKSNEPYYDDGFDADIPVGEPPAENFDESIF